jgi:hypothetical protein
VLCAKALVITLERATVMMAALSFMEVFISILLCSVKGWSFPELKLLLVSWRPVSFD